MCGIVGGFHLYDTVNASRALQHRGQEGFGIGFFHTKHIDVIRESGEVSKAVVKIPLSDIHGSAFIAHTRYSTIGTSTLDNVQPIYRNEKFEIALVHNGSLVNMREIERITGKSYAHLSDTHAIADLIEQSTARSIEDAIIEACSHLHGSYNLIVLHNGNVHVIRDPLGVHPFQLGLSATGEYLVASESYAFDFVDGKLIRDIHPGEYSIISKHACEPVATLPRLRHPHAQHCIFEFQYYASPFSFIDGIHVGTAREIFGQYLAREYSKRFHIPPGTLIGPVPDSGNQVTRGFEKELRLLGCDVEYDPYIVFRSHVSNERVFIEPTKERRLKRLREKHSVNEMQVRGRRVISGDDTIVAGLTATFITALMRGKGVLNHSYAIGAPPLIYPDLYGNEHYNRYKKSELIANKHKSDERAIAKEIGADNLCYLSLSDSVRAILKAQTLTRNRCFNVSPLDTVELNEHSFHTAPYSGFYAEGTGDFPVESLDFMPISSALL